MTLPPDPFGLDPRTDCFPSGCTLLDCILGGGWALGRIGNIVGDKSTGKTLLAIEACANFLRTFPDGRAIFIDGEAAFDIPYARSLGMPVEHVDFPEGVETVEDWYEIVDKVLEEQEAKEAKRKKGKPQQTIIFMDSIDSLSDRTEDGLKFDEGTYGGTKPKQIGKLFRKLNSRLSKANVTMILISQVRDNIGVTFGAKHRRSGGRALDFYASQILWLAHIKRVQGPIKKGHKRDIGVIVKGKMEKNKVAPPFRDCQFTILFGYGVEDAEACLNWMIEHKEHKPVFTSLEATKEARKGLARMDDKEHMKLTHKLSKHVTERWRAVEESFACKRSKYSHGQEKASNKKKSK